MSDLFSQPKSAAKKPSAYTASDIEVLEGLEPVRRRPGMYIGGTDERALHHLAVEILDNSMDEAVSGYADRIDFSMLDARTLRISDNGRGIPIDPHPKFPDKSALEVIATTLHSGGKFSGANYYAAGGLHGVGLAVVCALAEQLTVEVRRDGVLARQTYCRGKATSPLEIVDRKAKGSGTTVIFTPDAEIFGEVMFSPARLYELAANKAYLFSGITVGWQIPAELASAEAPESAQLHFPGGLSDLLRAKVGDAPLLARQFFTGRGDFPSGKGHAEWAVAFLDCAGFDDGFMLSFANTIATPNGGTHETGMKSALTRAVKAYAELAGLAKRAEVIEAADILSSAGIVLSAFVADPAFQGQTKERLTSADAARLVETAVKDHFDHWLAEDPKTASALVNALADRAEERKRRRKATETARASATKRLRLPGKLADCTQTRRDGTELFLVEGESAGGSAKQARARATQAVLPLRGKVLNVASASADKLAANQEISSLIEALGCGTRERYDGDSLRYGKVIIMTDADVDGAHIASLLMTLFYQETPRLITDGHLYLACPPLYRLTAKGKTVYADDEAARDRLLATAFKGMGAVEVGRFKGLGEMMPAQLKETTMSPDSRTLLRVAVADEGKAGTDDLIGRLMGRKAEARFLFIKENAKFATDLDI
ncbi:DNA topoisomerase 4 subunit B [Alphaproteobacteria bacterium]|nr:DNA topoisomerase 4 subunit B [Alphaproteobacteria bacterium]